MRSPAKSFVGFETLQNNMRMLFKMQLYIIFSLSFFVCIIAAALYFRVLTDSQRSVIRAYYLTYIHNNYETIDVMINGNTYFVTYEYARHNYKTYAESYIKIWKDKSKQVLLLYLLFIPSNILFAIRAKRQSESQFIRGARLISAKKLNKIIIKKEPVFLSVGQVSMPVSAEVKHTFLIGRPGVGKTVCLSQILEKIIARGDRVIVHDFKGDYLQKFYRPDKDIIFNPLDSRSAYWNFFDEIDSPIDVNAIGYALIPDAKGAGMDPFWNNASRDVVTGIINYLYRNDMKTYRELFKLSTSPSTEIAQLLLQTPGSEAGATTIADPESKQTGSIMSVMTQYTKIFGYMEDKEGKRFSIKKWLNDENAGNIFITNYSDLQDTLAPILSLMIDLFSRKLLSLPESNKRRIFFVLDEFGMLQKLQSIVPILTQGRSKGGGVLIGIQDLGQIEKIYGKEHRQSIVNACGSNVVFAVADNDTAKALSEKYGEFISIETYMTQSMGVQDNRDGLSINQQKQKEALILPSEITGLPDLNCYVQFPGYPIAKSILKWKGFVDRNQPFIMRQGLSYSELIEQETLLREAKNIERPQPDNTPAADENDNEEDINANYSFDENYNE
jgi:type IV conjugative transfer system coupling protein TraD